MNSKPVITADQETAIENLKCRHHKSVIIKMHSQDNRWAEPYGPLNDLELDDLIKILYTDIGYEVEPEYKEGDFVVHKQNGTIWKIEESINDGAAYHLHNGSGYYSGVNYYSLRHATETEIQQEKERRFWHGNGREVRELREGDLLYHEKSHELIEVLQYTCDLLGDTQKVRTGYEIDHVNGEFIQECRVICFVENRLDGDKYD